MASEPYAAYIRKQPKRAARVNELTAAIAEASKVLVAADAIDAFLLASYDASEPDTQYLEHAAAQLIERIDVVAGDGPLEERVAVSFK